MLDKIRLKNIHFLASHGVLEEEKKSKNDFFVDLEIGFDIRKAAFNDDVEKTVDYAKLYGIVEKIMTGPSVNLIETLAGKIADSALDQTPAVKAKVSVRKKNPPGCGETDFAEVEIKRRIVKI